MKGGEVPEDQTNEIDSLYRRWEREILWKANNLEDARHDLVCAGKSTGNWCVCRTRQEEVHEWEDWIIDNYDQAEAFRNWDIPIAVLARVTPPKQTGSPEHSAKASAKKRAVGQMP